MRQPNCNGLGSIDIDDERFREVRKRGSESVASLRSRVVDDDGNVSAGCEVREAKHPRVVEVCRERLGRLLLGVLWFEDNAHGLTRHGRQRLVTEVNTTFDIDPAGVAADDAREGKNGPE